jgi:hypothetical protein
MPRWRQISAPRTEVAHSPARSQGIRGPAATTFTSGLPASMTAGNRRGQPHRQRIALPRVDHRRGTRRNVPILGLLRRQTEAGGARHRVRRRRNTNPHRVTDLTGSQIRRRGLHRGDSRHRHRLWTPSAPQPEHEGGVDCASSVAERGRRQRSEHGFDRHAETQELIILPRQAVTLGLSRAKCANGVLQCLHAGEL